jgi:indolepyruvate ferredoxin oxidoreductase, alpha subunit
MWPRMRWPTCASSGVTGGALIIVGEDYGEGSSIMQERSHAFAMKSQFWLLDPRPNLPSIVKAVGDGFELSEASNTPVMLMVRIRACHVTGQFAARDNRRPAPERGRGPVRTQREVGGSCCRRCPMRKSMTRSTTAGPPRCASSANRAERGVRPNAPRGDHLPGRHVQRRVRALQRLGLADLHGETQVPIYCLNVTYPLHPDESLEFCAGKDAVLVIEEGQPEFIEQATGHDLLRAGQTTRLHGKDIFPMAGEYTGKVMLDAVGASCASAAPQLLPAQVLGPERTRPGDPDLSTTVPVRPPGFCTGCPERPIFAAMKLVQKELGEHQISADIGCHLFASLPPFNIGGATMGYGLGPASNGAFDGGARGAGASARSRSSGMAGFGTTG